MVEVFKTDVSTMNDAGNIIEMLRRIFPGSRINFDLGDCDHILRVEGKVFCINEVVILLSKNGFYCEALE